MVSTAFTWSINKNGKKGRIKKRKGKKRRGMGCCCYRVVVRTGEVDLREGSV